jgi:hypothetical protein
MAIRTKSNGRVITRNGRVSCSCCEFVIGDFEFGDVGECDCDTVVCYNADTNPSPASLTVGSGTYTNFTPNTDRFTVGNYFTPSAVVQGAIFGGTNNVIGWNNVVSEPSIVEISGAVGGDVAISHYAAQGSEAFGGTFPDDFEEVYQFFDFVPEFGLHPCGVCEAGDRNGPHNLVPVTFAMWPFTWVTIYPLSFFPCFPWFRLNFRVVSSFTPP